MSLWRRSSSWFLWSTSFLSGGTKDSGFLLYISCPRPRLGHFSKESWFLSLKDDGIRKQDLGTRVHFDTGVSLLLGLNWQSKEIPMCLRWPWYMHTSVHVFICKHLYSKLNVSSCCVDHCRPPVLVSKCPPWKWEARLPPPTVRLLTCSLPVPRCSSGRCSPVPMREQHHQLDRVQWFIQFLCLYPFRLHSFPVLL